MPPVRSLQLVRWACRSRDARVTWLRSVTTGSPRHGLTPRAVTGARCGAGFTRAITGISGFVPRVRLVVWILRLAGTPRRALTSGVVPQGVATYGAIDAQGFGERTERSRRF